MSNRSRRRQAERDRQRRNQALVAGGALAAIVVALFLVVAVLVSGGSDDPVVPVSLEDYAFSPQPLEAAEGATLQVENVGVEPHDLVIAGPGVGTPDVAPGGRRDLDLDGIAPGTYRIYCSLPGHVEAGMEGSITITEAP